MITLLPGKGEEGIKPNGPNSSLDAYYLSKSISRPVSELLASEQSERAQSCSCSIEISDTYVYIYMYIYMWPYVNLYAHARWYIMWEELSVDPFLNHSNQLKATLKRF